MPSAWSWIKKSSSVSASLVSRTDLKRTSRLKSLLRQPWKKRWRSFHPIPFIQRCPLAISVARLSQQSWLVYCLRTLGTACLKSWTKFARSLKRLRASLMTLVSQCLPQKEKNSTWSGLWSLSLFKATRTRSLVSSMLKKGSRICKMVWETCRHSSQQVPRSKCNSMVFMLTLKHLMPHKSTLTWRLRELLPCMKVTASQASHQSMC